MNSIIPAFNSLADGFITTYAWPIVWQSSLLALIIVAATQSVFRKASPQFKHLLWLLVILRLFLPPSFYLPTAIGNWGRTLLASLPFVEEQAATQASLPLTSSLSASFYSSSAYGIPSPLPSPYAIQRISAVTENLNTNAIFCLMWLMGVVFLIAFLVNKIARLRQTLKNASPPSENLTRIVQQYARMLGIRRRIVLKVSQELPGPVVCGLLHPTMVMPERILRELGDEELIPIVIHELAHIKRYDWLLNWLQLLAGIVYFFNPLLWFANRHIRMEREKACDDLVLVTLGIKRRSYADSLLRVLQHASYRPAFMTAFIGVIERRSNLASRIVRILDRNTRPTVRLPLVSIVVLIAFASCFITFRAKAVDDVTANNALARQTTSQPAKKVPVAKAERDQFINVLLGRVINEKAEPIPGATIYVTSRHMLGGNAQRQAIRSDMKGEFSITHLAPGNVTFKIMATGYKTKEFTAPSDSIDFTATLKRIRDEGTHYRVTVLDEKGKPVVNAPVRLLLRIFEESKGEKKTVQETRTNSQGTAEFLFKPKGKNISGAGIIVCDQEGYDLAIDGIEVDKDKDLKLVLRKPGQHWRGQVLDHKEKPIAGARVQVSTFKGNDGVSGGSFLHLFDCSYWTDQNGWFELSRFNKKDKISAKISAPLHSPTTACFDPETGWTYVRGWPAKRIRKSKNTNGIFHLASGGDIKGKVIIKKTGNPFTLQPSRINVVGGLTTIRSRPPTTRWTPVNEDGTFHIQGLPSLRNTLPLHELKPQQLARIKEDDLKWKLSFSSTHPKGRQYIWPSPRALDIQPGQTKEVIVELVEGTLVKGRVIDARTRQPHSDWVNVTAKMRGTKFSLFTNTRYDGIWEMYLVPGEYELEYYGRGLKVKDIPRMITVKPGEILDCGVHRVNAPSD